MRSNSWFEAYTTFWMWNIAIQRVAIERPDPACAHFKVTPRWVTTCRTNNLFDKQPPIIGSNQEQANTYPGVYDVLGRDFFVSAQFRF